MVRIWDMHVFRRKGAVVIPFTEDKAIYLESQCVPGLVNIQKAIEHGHRNSGFTH